MPKRPLKVLLFAEAVTLAHVARPIALGRALDPVAYALTLACASRYAAFAAAPGWPTVDLPTVPPQQFAQALAQGQPLYDLTTLQAYVAADLALIDRHRPDLIVGDFRLSLSVSARLARVPYLAIVNAYWTPFAPARFPLPVLPLTRRLPLPVARALFALARPLAFALHCRPMNRLRAQHGLPSLGHDLRRVYSDADHLLIPDIEALFPMHGPAAHFSRVGPLSWSPPVPWPAGLGSQAGDRRPVVYVTLGSSGPPQALLTVLDALRDLPVRVLASTAGGPAPEALPANASAWPYLPGDQAAAAASLVVCNGGSLAVQQALAAGVPVLGLASNMDQFLNMAPVVAAGAGRLLRTDRLSTAAVRMAAQVLLASTTAQSAARALAPLLHPPGAVAEVFDQAVAQCLQRAAAVTAG